MFQKCDAGMYFCKKDDQFGVAAMWIDKVVNKQKLTSRVTYWSCVSCFKHVSENVKEVNFFSSNVVSTHLPCLTFITSLYGIALAADLSTQFVDIVVHAAIKVCKGDM